MGTFSVWHWLIVLCVIGLLGIVPILTASSRKTLTRGAYAARTVGAYAVIFIMSAISGALSASIPLVSAVAFVVNMVVGLLIVLWSVHRTQHIGWSRWWCLLLLVPLVGIAFWLVLLFKAGDQQPLKVAEVFE